jgi:hypothetical protein
MLGLQERIPCINGDPIQVGPPTESDSRSADQ